MPKTKTKNPLSFKAIDPEIIQLADHVGGQPEAILEIYQALQARRGHLTIEAINDVARQLKIPVERAYGVATFYSMLSIKPRAVVHQMPVTKRVFEEIMQSDYVAQRLALPGERKVCLTGAEPQSLKFDVRCYVYDGHIQLVAARLVQGFGGGALVPLATAGASHLFGGVARPQTVIGGDVKHRVTSGDGGAQRIRLAQVANHALRVQALDVARRTGTPDQQAQFGAHLGERARDVASDEAGRSCHKRFHEGRYSSFSGCSEIPFSPAAFRSQYCRTHASQLCPAAMSRPLKARAAISA